MTGMHAFTRLVAVAAVSMSIIALSAPAQAQTPQWAQACMATTKNPWITSGYCAKHQAWDKYYCQCGYVPKGPETFFGFGRGGGRGDLDEDNVADGDIRPD